MKLLVNSSLLEVIRGEPAGVDPFLEFPLGGLVFNGEREYRINGDPKSSAMDFLPLNRGTTIGTRCAGERPLEKNV